MTPDDLSEKRRRWRELPAEERNVVLTYAYALERRTEGWDAAADILAAEAEAQIAATLRALDNRAAPSTAPTLAKHPTPWRVFYSDEAAEILDANAKTIMLIVGYADGDPEAVVAAVNASVARAPAPPPVDASERPFAEERSWSVHSWPYGPGSAHKKSFATKAEAVASRERLISSNIEAEICDDPECCSQAPIAASSRAPDAPTSPLAADQCSRCYGYFGQPVDTYGCACGVPTAPDAPKRTEHLFEVDCAWSGTRMCRVCNAASPFHAPLCKVPVIEQQLTDALAEVDRLKLSNDAHRRALGDAPKLLSTTIGERDHARAEVERLTADWTKASQESLDAYLKNEALYDLIEGFKNRETRIVEARIKAESSLAAAIQERDRALAFDVTDEQRKRARDAIWRLYLRGSATQDEELDAVLAALCGEGGAG